MASNPPPFFLASLLSTIRTQSLQRIRLELIPTHVEENFGYGAISREDMLSALAQDINGARLALFSNLESLTLSLYDDAYGFDAMWWRTALRKRLEPKSQSLVHVDIQRARELFYDSSQGLEDGLKEDNPWGSNSSASTVSFIVI